MRLMGLDPGLRRTGWGVIEADGNRLSHVANGIIAVPADAPVPERLAVLYDQVVATIDAFQPDEAAVEESFVNRNAASALLLGHARGVVLLAPARAGLPLAEYAANRIKKSVVGAGHAGKPQVAAMVAMLLPGSAAKGPDAADALAVAICHAHHRATAKRVAAGMGAPS